MTDRLFAMIDLVERLTEAIYTLAAAELTRGEHLPPDQAATRTAELRHEVRIALANWRPRYVARVEATFGQTLLPLA